MPIYTEMQARSCKERGLFRRRSPHRKSPVIQPGFQRPSSPSEAGPWFMTSHLQCRPRHRTRQWGIDLRNCVHFEIQLTRSFPVFSQLPRPSRWHIAALVGPTRVSTLRALSPIRVVEVAELACVPMAATVRRITADCGMMRVGTASSPASVRDNRRMMISDIGLRSGE